MQSAERDLRSLAVFIVIYPVDALYDDINTGTDKKQTGFFWFVCFFVTKVFEINQGRTKQINLAKRLINFVTSRRKFRAFVVAYVFKRSRY